MCVCIYIYIYMCLYICICRYITYSDMMNERFLTPINPQFLVYCKAAKGIHVDMVNSRLHRCLRFALVDQTVPKRASLRLSRKAQPHAVFLSSPLQFLVLAYPNI